MPPIDDLERARKKRYRQAHLLELRRKDRERKRNKYVAAKEATSPIAIAFKAWITGKTP